MPDLLLWNRVPHHFVKGYTYDVEIDEEPGEVKKIMSHLAKRDGRIIFETPQPTYKFMTKVEFANFIGNMERATQ